jgi:hypothetical protein
MRKVVPLGTFSTAIYFTSPPGLLTFYYIVAPPKPAKLHANRTLFNRKKKPNNR